MSTDDREKQPAGILMIGCGGITRAHLPAFLNHGDRFRCLAACDPSAAARERLATSLEPVGRPQLYADLDSMLQAHAAEAEMAIIVTPHYLHYEQATTCIEQALPVLIEKPVCLNLDETRRLLAESQSRKVPVIAGQNRRFDSSMRFLRHWITSDPGHFGSLRSFDITAWQSLESLYTDRSRTPWLLDGELAGGGVAISLLIHSIDCFRYLCDMDFVQVSAAGRFDAPLCNGAESSCAAILVGDNGAVGTAHGNYLARRSAFSESMHAIGEHGTFGSHLPKLQIYGGPYYFGSTGGSDHVQAGDAYDGIRQISDEELAPFTGNSFVGSIANAISSLRTGTEAENSIERNFNTMATIEALHQSMAAGGALVEVEQLVSVGVE